MSGFIRPNIKSLAKKQSLNAPSGDITLNLGEALYPPSPEVVKAVQNAAVSINRYPDNLAVLLRNAIVEYARGVAPSQVIVGNGSDGLIDLILKVILDYEGEIVVPIPSYYVYDLTARILGGKTVFVSRKDDFSLDVPALLSAVTPKTRAIFLANPNNPTGNLTSHHEIEEIAREANCWVVVDECYFEFSGLSAIDLMPRYDNLIIMRTFSKGFGLAGIRVGYCLGPEGFIERMQSADQIFPVNQLGQVAALAALSDIPYMKSQVSQLKERRTFLAKGLSALGFKVYPSEANFLLIDWSTFGGSSLFLVEELARRGIQVADYRNKQGLGNTFARLTVASEEINLKVLATIATILEEHKASLAVPGTKTRP